MYCMYCGAHIPLQDAKFCHSCGKQIPITIETKEQEKVVNIPDFDIHTCMSAIFHEVLGRNGLEEYWQSNKEKLSVINNAKAAQFILNSVYEKVDEVAKNILCYELYSGVFYYAANVYLSQLKNMTPNIQYWFLFGPNEMIANSKNLINMFGMQNLSEKVIDNLYESITHKLRGRRISETDMIHCATAMVVLGGIVALKVVQQREVVRGSIAGILHIIDRRNSRTLLSNDEKKNIELEIQNRYEKAKKEDKDPYRIIAMWDGKNGSHGVVRAGDEDGRIDAINKMTPEERQRELDKYDYHFLKRRNFDLDELKKNIGAVVSSINITEDVLIKLMRISKKELNDILNCYDNRPSKADIFSLCLLSNIDYESKCKLFYLAGYDIEENVWGNIAIRICLENEVGILVAREYFAGMPKGMIGKTVNHTDGNIEFVF